MGVAEQCIPEFSLRRHQNPRVYATTLKPEDSSKLQISAVLRDISDSLLRGSVDEGMLDLLETLEQLLQLQGDSVILGSLKSAYYWTAVECTLRFMWPENASDMYKGILERIWRKRIGMLKEKESDLVSDELLKWESDLEKAFLEPEMYLSIREVNIRYNAMCHLNQLVNEHLALLSCCSSSLEPEGQEMLLKRKGQIRGNNVGRDSVNEGGGVEYIDVDEQEAEREASVDDGDAAVALECKDFLWEIEGVVEPYMNAMDFTVDVTPQPTQANRTKPGGGQAEDRQGTLSLSSSSGRVRPYLPTPLPLNAPPLKMVKPDKPRGRRPVRFWTQEEVEALREGVRECGKSWKAIKDAYPLVLATRTEVDLKDKWRNLMGRQ